MKITHQFITVSILCLMLLLPAISIAEDSNYFYLPNPYLSEDGIVYVGPFGSGGEMTNQTNPSSYPDNNFQTSGPTGGTGFGEPFYPNNPPSAGPHYTPEPIQQITPVMTPNQETGYSEPFYPNNPPGQEPSGTPAPDYQPPSQGPVYTEPFYPEYPPSPQPYQTPVPTERTPVYYPSYRYPDTSVTIHERWDDASCRYRSPYYGDSWYYSDRDYVYGTIEVASSPIRAEVFVDNRFRGYTPSSGYLKLYDIRPGTYTIRLRYSGYYDYYEDIYVFRGRTATVYGKMVRIGDPIQKTGLLYIQSEPTGAGIYLDNEYKGITPVSLRNIPSGERNILLRKEGYADYISRMQIVEDQTISIAAVLNPMTRAPEPVITAVMVEAPLPTPTRAGSEGVIFILSIIAGMILLSLKQE